VIPNDIPGSIFAGPLPVRGVWGQYPQSECFATPYLAESPVHIKRVKKNFKAEPQKTSVWRLGFALDPYWNTYSAPKTHGWWRWGRCPFPKNPNPTHSPSGLRPVDQRLLYNKPGIPSNNSLIV